jgi:hypothetical protein
VLRLRYVVMNQERDWVIFQGRRRLGSYTDKTQATCAAIGLAEKAGNRERPTEVLVRHEDGRFLIEWTYGNDARLTDAAKPVTTSVKHLH